MATGIKEATIPDSGFTERYYSEEIRLHTLGELTGGDLAWVYLYPFVFQKIPFAPIFF